MLVQLQWQYINYSEKMEKMIEFYSALTARRLAAVLVWTPLLEAMLALMSCFSSTGASTFCKVQQVLDDLV